MAPSTQPETAWYRKNNDPPLYANASDKMTITRQKKKIFTIIKLASSWSE